MPSNQNKFGQTDHEMRKLLSEIAEFEEEFEPITIEELEAIESSFQSVDVPPEENDRQRQYIEELRQELFEDVVSLPGIIKRAQQLEIQPQSLTDRLRLSIDILMKLEQRIIDGIPDMLVGMLAKILDTQKAAVYQYLQQPPEQLNLAASSQTQPTASRTQSWQEAVETSSQLSQENKEFWLKQS